MRKLEAEMLAAIRHKEDWKGANTQVSIGIVDTRYTYVRVYDHCIAEIRNPGEFMLICCQAQHTDGVVSATTVSRLNVLLGALADGDFSVHRHRGETLAYYNGASKVIDGDEWYKVPLKAYNKVLDTSERSA